VNLVLSNFSLLAHCIARVALNTGIGPAVVIAFCLKRLSDKGFRLKQRREFFQQSFRDGGQLADASASFDSSELDSWATSPPRKALVISTPLTISEVVERKVRRSA
jgi:hypothetical protein